MRGEVDIRSSGSVAGSATRTAERTTEPHHVYTVNSVLLKASCETLNSVLGRQHTHLRPIPFPADREAFWKAKLSGVIQLNSAHSARLVKLV